jgi:hypothetical protein
VGDINKGGGSLATNPPCDCGYLPLYFNIDLRYTKIMSYVFVTSIPVRIASPQASIKKDHWAKRAAIKNNLKRAVKFSLNTCCTKPPCRIRLTRIAPRALDEHDNLRTALKPCIDAVADYLIPGLAMGQADSSKDLEWEFYQESKGKGVYGLRIEIQKI